MADEEIMSGMKPKPIFVPGSPPDFTEMQKRGFSRGRGRMTRPIAPLLEKEKRREKVDVFWKMEEKRKMI